MKMHSKQHLPGEIEFFAVTDSKFIVSYPAFAMDSL